MTRLSIGGIALLLSLSYATGAGAQQVHRCADGTTYTDRPCYGATDVDVRPNILDAGPRVAPQQGIQPQPAIILPEPSPAPPPSALPSGSTALERRDQRESEHRGRTYR